MSASVVCAMAEAVARCDAEDEYSSGDDVICGQGTVEHKDADVDELHKLKALTESLLRDVAERDVDLDEQEERHAKELERQSHSITPADRAWLAMPMWMHGIVHAILFLCVLQMR